LQLESKEDIARDSRIVVDWFEIGSEAKDAKSREQRLTVMMDMGLALIPEGALKESATTLKREGLIVSAALYNNATRRVARSQVEQLTQLTEEQLRALSKLNSLLVKHIQDRNRVRAEIKRIEPT